MSAMLTVTAKGQVTLSEDILKHLGIASGEKIVISKLAGGRIEIVAANGSITRVFGLLKRNRGPVLTIAQIKAAAADGWSGKSRRALQRPTKK